MQGEPSVSRASLPVGPETSGIKLRLAASRMPQLQLAVEEVGGSAIDRWSVVPDQTGVVDAAQILRSVAEKAGGDGVDFGRAPALQAQWEETTQRLR